MLTAPLLNEPLHTYYYFICIHASLPCGKLGEVKFILVAPIYFGNCAARPEAHFISYFSIRPTLFYKADNEFISFSFFSHVRNTITLRTVLQLNILLSQSSQLLNMKHSI